MMLVTKWSHARASSRVRHAGQAMAKQRAAAKSGPMSRSMLVTMTAVPPPMEWPVKGTCGHMRCAGIRLGIGAQAGWYRHSFCAPMTC